MALKKKERKEFPGAFRQAFEQSKQPGARPAEETRTSDSRPGRGRKRRTPLQPDPVKGARELKALERLGLSVHQQNIEKVRLLLNSGFEPSLESMALDTTAVQNAHRLLTKWPFFVPNFHTLVSRFADDKARQQAELELDNLLLLAPERTAHVLDAVRGSEFYSKDVGEFLATKKGKAFLERLEKAIEARRASRALH